MGASSFFCMDENFLLHRKRALRLLELMEKHDKAWALYVFSSANVLRSYTIDQLVRLGVSWVWMGIEGCNSQYVKLQGIDTFELVRELQSHGIRVLGSTIIGLEEPHAGEHRRGHRACRPARHRLPPVHALHADPRHAAACRADGQGRDEGPAEFSQGDIHGQSIFNYRHPHIPAGMESRVHGAGVRPRLRAERAEHAADRPHDAGRLAAVQESPRRPRPPPLCLGGPRAGHDLLRRGRRGKAVLPRNPAMQAKMSACSRSCTPSSAGSRG